jgi:hypothetical protein
MPRESSLGYRAQQGLELRKCTVLGRTGSVLNRRVSSVTRTRVGSPSGSLMDFGELAEGDTVVGCIIEHAKELRTCLLVATQLEQRAAKGDPRGQIGGMLSQAGLAHPDGFLAVTCTAMLFSELRKSNRRRVLLDPASKVFDPRVVGHPNIMGRL